MCFFYIQDAVKTNHRAQVIFKFMYRPEYVRVGSRLLFRQGTTKGVGEVIKVHPYIDNPAR
jgi:GTPase